MVFTVIFQTNGFFIECGALDGETRSNTLYMEKFLNWSGLLIEADPLNFAQAVRKNRKTWLSPTCLSKTSYPQIVCKIKTVYIVLNQIST